MSFIKQKHETDCGVCCLAMLTHYSYDQAKELLFGCDLRRTDFRTKTKQFISALSKSRAYSVTQKRLHPATSWDKIPDNSLVKIPWHPSYKHEWHWVVWKNKKIYDPARGVFKPKKYDKEPSSYLHIKRWNEK